MEVLGEFNEQAELVSSRELSELPTPVLANLGRWDLIETAIDAGNPDLTTKDCRTGNTILHIATSQNNSNALRMLLVQKKMQPDHTDYYGRTPLHPANSVEMAKLLIEYRSDLNCADSGGATPLSTALMKGNLEVAVYLVEAGANVNVKQLEISDLLFTAIDQGNIKAERILLSHGADVRGTNEDGLTPGQLAAKILDESNCTALFGEKTVKINMLGFAKLSLITLVLFVFDFFSP